MRPDVVEKVLSGYFTGTRDSLRSYEFLELDVHGGDGDYEAVAVDVSRSGILLRITDPAFASPEIRQSIVLFTARVRDCLDGSFGIAFRDRDVNIRAEVVRVTGCCSRGSNLVLIGCRFAEALTPEQCGELGIEYAADRAPDVKSFPAPRR